MAPLPKRKHSTARKGKRILELKRQFKKRVLNQYNPKNTKKSE